MADSQSVAHAIRAAASSIGYTDLRVLQESAIKSFVAGNDVFIAIPTGGGKSLCYSLLPAVFDRIRGNVTPQCLAIVVSPLVALIQDQVRGLTGRGVSAVHLKSSEDDDFSDMCNGVYQVLFISPEILLRDPGVRDMLLSSVFQDNLVVLAIDEAHCVKKWGDSFRREFSKLGEIRSLIPEGVHVMALTATATLATRKAICKSLGLVKPVVVLASPDKPNIKFIVISNSEGIEETFASLADELQQQREMTERKIVFCRTYDACAEIYLFVRDRLGREMTNPIGAPDKSQYRMLDMFTSCTRPKVKETILKAFLDPDSHLRVVVATIAFGMGLDCPNVRSVIHWGPSEDIEQYIQETGRAGRDGQPAKAILYHGGPELTYRNVNQEIKEYCLNKDKCRRNILLSYFDAHIIAHSSQLCSCCDVCECVCQCSKCFY